MLVSILLILFGMLALYIGAEALVHGACRLTISLGVSPMIVGLTVVSLGTSLPEGVSSLFAQILGGKGDIALGNVIGSNLANIGLVAGIAALIRPIKVERSIVVQEGLLMVGVTALLLLFMAIGTLATAAGAFFLFLLLCFIVWQVAKAKNGKTEEKTPPRKEELLHDIFYLSGGLVGLLLGGYLLIEGAVAIATELGVSERVIGLTVVALGTSLPELATSVVAAWRGKEELSIGNVVGSNIFNILFIIGGVALISPIAFSSSLLTFDAPVMFAFTLILALMMWHERGISRVEGSLLLLGYTLYVVALF